MTVASSVMQFALLPLQGLGQGAQPIVSYNFGAKDSARVKAAFKRLLVVSVAYARGVRRGIVRFRDVVAESLRRDVHVRRNAYRIYFTRAPYLYGGDVHDGSADGVSDDFRGDRQRQSLDTGGGGEEIRASSSAHLHNARRYYRR